jgi:hypothetical protein
VKARRENFSSEASCLRQWSATSVSDLHGHTSNNTCKISMIADKSLGQTLYADQESHSVVIRSRDRNLLSWKN